MFVVFAMALLRSMPGPKRVIALMPYCFNNKLKQDFRIRRPTPKIEKRGTCLLKTMVRFSPEFSSLFLEGCI